MKTKNYNVIQKQETIMLFRNSSLHIWTIVCVVIHWIRYCGAGIIRSCRTGIGKIRTDGSHLEAFCGGESMERLMMMRNWIWIRPGNMRVEMMTTTRSCKITCDRQKAVASGADGARGDTGGPLRQPGDKTGIK